MPLPPRDQCTLRTLPEGSRPLRVAVKASDNKGSKVLGVSASRAVLRFRVLLLPGHGSTGSASDSAFAVEAAWGIPRAPDELVKAAVVASHPCRSDFPLLSALKRAIQADASTQPAELARLRALLFRKWSTRARELEGQPSKEPLKLMPAYSQLSSRG